MTVKGINLYRVFNRIDVVEGAGRGGKTAVEVVVSKVISAVVVAVEIVEVDVIVLVVF